RLPKRRRWAPPIWRGWLPVSGRTRTRFRRSGSWTKASTRRWTRRGGPSCSGAGSGRSSGRWPGRSPTKKARAQARAGAVSGARGRPGYPLGRRRLRGWRRAGATEAPAALAPRLRPDVRGSRATFCRKGTRTMSKQSGPRALGPRLEQLFDVVVIGGGSNGVAVARDAALRGLKVALFEKVDFGYGTVSRSTRLIHGGLRYLELFDFGLVREGLREREILLRTAPHLVRPLAFFTPVYDHTRVGVPKLRVGMWLYDLLSYDKSIPNHTFLTAEQAKAAEPLLNPDGLRGAFIYYD